MSSSLIGEPVAAAAPVVVAAALAEPAAVDVAEAGALVLLELDDEQPARAKPPIVTAITGRATHFLWLCLILVLLYGV